MHTLRRFLRKILRKLVGVRRLWGIYAYDFRRQGEGRRDPAIQEYSAHERIPRPIARQMVTLAGLSGYWFMRQRMWRHDGKLLCLVQDGKIAAYGWVQGWKPFRRRFNWLVRDAMMLGFYKTLPPYRGQGLYGRLLAHSIAACDNRNRIPLIIVVDPENKASVRGIEKAGFAKLGVFEIRQGPMDWGCRHRIVSQDAVLGTTPDGRVVVEPLGASAQNPRGSDCDVASAERSD